MQGRRLTISRGLAPAPETAGAATPPRSLRAADPVAAAADFCLVHHRIAALERLGLLRDKGVLTADEFAAEKGLVLRLPAEELMLAPEDMRPPRGPSLLGRMLNRKLLAAGAVAGLCLSAYTAPRDLMLLADQTARMLG